MSVYLETQFHVFHLNLGQQPPLFLSFVLPPIFVKSPLLYHRNMGCRLPKLRKAEERQSPGNIYSTLRRPQVETKVGVAYTYHFLDFLLGKEGTDKIFHVLSVTSI